METIFFISTVHELSSREKSRQSQDLNPGPLGEKRERYLRAMQPSSPPHPNSSRSNLRAIATSRSSSFSMLGSELLVSAILKNLSVKTMPRRTKSPGKDDDDADVDPAAFEGWAKDEKNSTLPKGAKKLGRCTSTPNEICQQKNFSFEILNDFVL